MTTKALVDKMIAEMLAGNESVIPILQDAIEAGVEGAGKQVYVIITEKSYTHRGKVTPERRSESDFALITPKKSIRLFGLYNCHEYNCAECKKNLEEWQAAGRPTPNPKPHRKAYDRTYVIGDTGNRKTTRGGLHLLDKIVQITPKGVTFETGGAKRERHNLARFSMYHATFDLIKAQNDNYNWMD